MIDNFKTDLVIRAASMTPEQTLKAMGYRNPSSANYQRLQNVLESPEFGLDEGGFDFRYGSEDFLRTLCVVVGMDMELADPRITHLKTYLEEERAAFKPYLWVDTGFQRKNQPLFVLAACEHMRYQHFQKGFWRLPIDKQLGLAQCRVREHVYETGGDIGIWGQIKQYWFYYKKDAAYLLARNGEVIGKREGPVPNGASVSRELGVVISSTRETTQ